MYFAGAQLFSPNLFQRCHIFDARRKQQTNACNNATLAHRVCWLLFNAFTAQFESFSPFLLVGVLLNQPLSWQNKRLPSQDGSQTFTPLSWTPGRHRPCRKRSHQCMNPIVFELRDLQAKNLISRSLGSRKACRWGRSDGDALTNELGTEMSKKLLVFNPCYQICGDISRIGTARYILHTSSS